MLNVVQSSRAWFRLVNFKGHLRVQMSFFSYRSIPLTDFDEISWDTRVLHVCYIHFSSFITLIYWYLKVLDAYCFCLSRKLIKQESIIGSSWVNICWKQFVRRYIQKFPDWVDNEIYAYDTLWKVTQRVMAAKLTWLAHKIIAIQLHLVAESCTICSSRSRRPARKLLDTLSYVLQEPLIFTSACTIFPLC
jgi:hypothetical protein